MEEGEDGGMNGEQIDPELLRPILISSIDFEAENPELEQIARAAVSMKPNFAYSLRDIEMVRGSSVTDD